METYEPFAVVVVPFPFTDRETTKRRPALVLSSAAFEASTGHVILCMITTASHSSWESDVRLRDWKSAGLPKPSIARAKVFTLDNRFILRKLNKLTKRDASAVIRAFGPVFPFPNPNAS